MTAASVMAAVVVLVGKALEDGGGELRYPSPPATDAVTEPIAREANVFRSTEAELGVAPAFHGHSQAHVRSRDMYERLRAYPGAPPRIPHGLTGEEYRGPSCNVCHLRGGWVARLSAYAPVTPHPDYASCLQCHLPRDELVGRALPSEGDSIVCGQCHIDPDAPPEIFVELDWERATWPATGSQAMPDGPNRIPHDFQTRSNCLACHSGPGAVIELRTDHPERVNCRQCHVRAVENIRTYPEPSDESGQPAGGDS